MWGPNTVTCQVQTGEVRYYVVGCYLPPLDKEGKSLDDGVDTINKMPRGCIPMLLGDLNVNLDVPQNEQEAKVAAAMDHHRMACASKHFLCTTAEEIQAVGEMDVEAQTAVAWRGTGERSDLQIEAGLLPDAMKGA